MSPGPIARLHLAVLERSLSAATALGNRFRPPAAQPAHLALGQRGELAAYFHLRRMGWTIVARQWRSAKLRGDLDLVGWQGETLCFVEVKTRGARDAFAAEVAVDKDKRIMLRRMARAYLHQLENAQRIAVRFDIVTVYLIGAKQEFHVFPAAFGWLETQSESWY